MLMSPSVTFSKDSAIEIAEHLYSLGRRFDWQEIRDQVEVWAAGNMPATELDTLTDWIAELLLDWETDDQEFMHHDNELIWHLPPSAILESRK